MERERRDVSPQYVDESLGGQKKRCVKRKRQESNLEEDRLWKH